MGLEGLLAQLQQVVRTATQFSTVDAVQILIEGQNEEYLGGDGVYIGEPLTPEDLPN
jgi:spore germination protein GerM